MFEVLQVRKDGTAVVSTKGLCRVVTSDGESIDEMCTRSEAKYVVDAFNACNTDGKFRAKIVPYSKVK